MSNLTNDQILDTARETLEWGGIVAELWTGTLYEKQIEYMSDNIRKALADNDLKEVQNQVYDLAQYLDVAEEEYKKADEH